MTRLSFRSLALVVPFCALVATAQTPTPTPPPSGTPTPTPTPPPNTSLLPATAVHYLIPNGGAYDSANLVLGADGALWAASGIEDVIAKLSPDAAAVTRWAFPRDATPNSLLANADGTFWVTELGGFNVAHFDPATSQLTEWPDIGRRPTSLVRRADGKLWMPETGGALALFDPAASSFTYYRATGTFSLAYPFLDADGTLFACDFLVPALFSFAPDGSSAKRWELPAASAPSKVIRGFDEAIWISLYSSAQIARVDTTTNEVRIYQLPYADLPYDLHAYKDRILFTEQRNNFVGFLDPHVAVPAQTVTVTPTNETVISTTRTVVPVTSTLVSTTADVAAPTPVPVAGFGGAGLAYYSAGAGTNFALLVDESHGRIWLGSGTSLTRLLPPGNLTGERLLPSAASIAGRFGARWKTELVTWNRGLAKDSAGVAQPVTFGERLLPSRWIAGISPAGGATLAPGQILSQPDALGVSMNAPDSFGAIRLTASANVDELFAWGRVSLVREDGGSYGFSQNLVTADRAIGAGESGFLFASPDAAGQRTNAGLYVVESAAGLLSVVDADGATRASVPFDFPAGYHTQLSTVFDALGIPALPSARVVVSITSGKVLPFGTSIDNRTNDPIGLDVLAAKSPLTSQTLPLVSRGSGALGSGARTALQLFNPGGADAAVTLSFRAAAAPGGGAAPAPQSASVTVPAGKVVTLDDALATVGVASGTGSLEVTSASGIFAFARVTAGAPGGGSYGYGVSGRPSTDAVAAGSRGVFIDVADNTPTRSDLELVNPSDAAATVTLKLSTTAGADVATRDVAVPPRATLLLENVWSAVAGTGTELGRLDVVPADGSAPVLAALLRQDRVTGDADAVAPFVMAR